MASSDNNGGRGLPLVPEAVLKKRHDMDEMKAHRAAQAIANPRGNRKVFSSKTKMVKVIKPEKFVSRGRSRRNHEIRYNRVMKKGMQKRASNHKIVKSKEVPAVADNTEDRSVAAALEEETKVVKVAANSVGSDVVFAVRIRDGAGMSRKVRKALSNMRLRSVNEGVFLRYDESTRKMLHLVEPFVAYGIPSKSLVTDLIRQRGHGKIDGKRVPLTDNTIIEKALGDETGIICVEDLVHEVYSVGDGFGAASAFLWPFRLTASRSKFQKEKLDQKDGGRDEYGDRGEEIEDYVRNML
mmetsp:Transcript_4655/g.9034  ORF Transcript_4655/g.9034 Transcript_4655/m.9034 type:complete len:297 (-) Transcript_4655:823-1713(-)